MKYKAAPGIKSVYFIAIFLFVFIFSVPGKLFSQSSSKPTRQSAMDAFSEGKYEVAYNQFVELLTIYPKDPLYKYYTGVSLVKLEKDPEKAALHLEQAVKGSSVVKSLPSDAFFYLGRAQQMSGRFTDAIRSYNLYTEQAGKRAAKEDNVPQLIEQCRNKEGKLAVASTAAASSAVIDKNAEVAPAGTNPVAGAVVVKEAAEKPLPPEYSKIMDEALLYQHKADSMNALAETKKKELDKLPVTEQAAEKTIISESLILAASFQTQADNKYAEADALMNGKRASSPSSAPGTASAGTTSAATTSPGPTSGGTTSAGTTSAGTTSAGTTVEGTIAAGTVAAATVAAGAIASDKEPAAGKPTDSIPPKGETTDSSTVSVSETNTSSAGNPAAIAAASGAAVISTSTGSSAKKIEIYKYFEVLPKPVTDPAAKIPIDPEIPAGLIYRIQMGAFRNPVSLAFFKGIMPVHGFKSKSSGVTTYYVGLFRRSEDAKKALAEVRAKGFKDSFVISQVEGKTVSAERAAVLEKEWGNKPFATIGDVKNDNASDTIPPSLVFRVEAIRSVKALKDDAVEELKKVAGNRGLDILTLENGNFTYLIGKFITFTSAAEYADLLIRNGYRDAKVVAWLGKKEIPVETARQLFENP